MNRRRTIRCLLCNNTPRFGEMYCTPCQEKVDDERYRADRKNKFARLVSEAEDLPALKALLVDLIYELWPEQ